MAIDGHGRNEYFERAWKEGAIIAGEKIPPGDERFMTVNVIILKGETLTASEKSKICLTFVSQNEVGHKTVTEVGKFRFLVNSIFN